MINEQGVFTDDFKTALPTMLGDSYYNDPDTKQQPTKAFDDIKDIASLAKGYLDNKRAASKKLEGMIKVPGEGARPDEIAAFRKATGVPDTADKYELAIPDGDQAAGFNIIADAVKAEAHKAGISAASLKTVWAGVVDAINKQTADLEAKGLEMIKADEDKLKGELKEKYDAFVKTGNDALAKFKVAPEVTQLLKGYGIDGHPAIRKLLAEIAPLVLQGSTVTGEEGAPSAESWFTNYQYDESGKPKQ